jgi:hypothetical protein
MLDPNLVYNARWQDLYTFFAAGNPPLAIRLMAINTIILVYFIIRRARGKNPMQAQTAFIVQALLIAANLFIMFAPNIMTVARSVHYAV